MNILLIVGILVAFGGVLLGYILDEGILSALVKPSSAAIVFGGIIGFILISFPREYLREIPAAMRLVFFRKKRDYGETIDLLYNLGTIARKEGILALESEAAKIDDPFIKEGVSYIADGVEPDFLESMIQNKVDAVTTKYEKAAKIMESAGGAAPAMGVLGTVMGMVSILREMSGDTSELGGKIATAFIATMYGVGSANLLLLPLGGLIKNCAEEESTYLELVGEGLLSILEGKYPARMKENLLAKVGEVDTKKKEPETKTGK